jgi:hypothetical protein
MQADISPYFGACLNVGLFEGEGGSRMPPVQQVVVNTAFGLALHGGADDEITPNWLADINVKTLFLRPEVRMNSGLVHAGSSSTGGLSAFRPAIASAQGACQAASRCLTPMSSSAPPIAATAPRMSSGVMAPTQPMRKLGTLVL